MLSNQEVVALVSDMESDRIERTVSLTNKDKYCEAICAFANNLPNHRQPSYLLIGVTDDGKVGGLTISDDFLLTLGAIRSEGNILPQPFIGVDRYSLEGGEIAVVTVHASDLPPVRYKGRVHIRVGPRKAIANEQEERVLSERRVALARSFDAQPARESTIDDLALGQFDAYRREVVDAETIESNHRPVEQQLASLRLYDPQSKNATNAGLILFGKNTRFFLPGAYVQYLQLPGTDLTDEPIDQDELDGDLNTVVRALELRLKSINKTRLVKLTAFEEKEVQEYPELALRELLMNAVMHRNYNSNAPIRFYVFSDHIEIQSPGGLYGEATPENFPLRNSYRNPVIAEAMKSQGFVNRFGYGVQRAQARLEANGNRPAEFEFDTHTVLVKIFKNIQ